MWYSTMCHVAIILITKCLLWCKHIVLVSIGVGIVKIFPHQAGTKDDQFYEKWAWYEVEYLKNINSASNINF